MEEYSLLEKLVMAVLNGIIAVINLLPALPSDGIGMVTTSLDFMVDIIAKAGFLIPVADIFIIMGLIFSFRIALLSIFVVNWVIRRIFDVIP